jgi:hypothetical protein
MENNKNLPTCLTELDFSKDFETTIEERGDYLYLGLKTYKLNFTDPSVQGADLDKFTDQIIKRDYPGYEVAGLATGVATNILETDNHKGFSIMLSLKKKKQSLPEIGGVSKNVHNILE